MNTTVGSTGSISFEIAKGTHYKFQINKPGAPSSPYTVSPKKGSLTMPAANKLEKIKFKLFGSAETFHEAGLPAHTSWSVSVTGPSPSLTVQTLSSITATVKFILTNGSYTYSVPAVGLFTAAPNSGSVAVTAPPHGLPTVNVVFTDPPQHANFGAGSATRLASVLYGHTNLVATVPGREA